MTQLDIFSAAAHPCTDKVLGELPVDWTWISLIGLGAYDWRNRDIARERRLLRRIHAAVRLGILEGATKHSPEGRPPLYVPDGQQPPRWFERLPVNSQGSSCYVVRLRRPA